MDDLISRQAAICEYQEVCNGIKCGECPFLIKVNTEKGSHLITECKLEAFLHNLPSAERHGRWIVHGTAPWLVVECSNCGAKWHHWSGEKTNNYCGECGAKMDEVAE